MISHDKLYTDEVFERLRNQGNYLYLWETMIRDRFQMGSYPVKSIRDLTTGFDSVQEDQRAVLPSQMEYILKMSHVLRHDCGFAVPRPSAEILLHSALLL